MVNAPVLHRSNLMTPLERIPSEGDARLKMTASWELIELEDSPARPTVAGDKINNEVINIRQCSVTMAVLVVNRHFNVVELIFTAIYRSTTWQRFNSCHIDINSFCLGVRVVFILKETILIKCS